MLIQGIEPTVQEVQGMCYRPGEEEIAINESGCPAFNMYKAPAFTAPIEHDYQIQRTIEQHITNLVGNTNAPILLDFISFIVQNPGKKIRWAILIQSIEGAGKGLLGTLLNHLLGKTNVGYPKQSNIEGRFTSWADKQLQIIAEIRAAGKIREKFTDALKQWITDDDILCEKKCQDEYMKHNVANFLLFTNNLNALNLIALCLV